MKQHIQNIEISNFKSIKDLKIDGCKKINIFAGKPNAGKSNILEALAMFDNIFNHKEIEFRKIIRFEYDSQLCYEGNIDDGIKLRVNDNGITFYLANFEINKIVDANPISFDLYSDFYYIINSINNLKFKENLEYYKFKIVDEKQDVKKKQKNNTLNVPFGENVGHVISTNSNLRNFVNEFLKQNNLKLLIEKNTNEIKIFKEYQDGTVFSLPYSMIADTLQRLIFYKAAIISNQDSVLLFEEPEAHCFEPYILEFTNEVKYNENNNQFFMVTHSDFIIQEFLRDEESKNDLQIYLVNNVDGKTEVKKLDREGNDDVYEYGMNVYFNFDSLWENN